ncbi:hypothetical protein CARUB_v10006020mg [Capsella rubella]|uniref:Uncharacterized protein n=1 Tax=Capsella rubella TaxID=81985 RepID=R0H2D1_9BRAS|nr:hypothetical protein CARUB_v10006020mg [Capsella rubella]
MANDRNTKIAQKAFEIVDNVYGKSQNITLKSYVPRNEFPTYFYRNSYEYGGPKFYTLKESTSTITAGRVIYQSSIVKPIVYHPTDSIQYFSGARPFTGHVDRFERPKEQAISCDEAAQRYGGVLIKEFRN